VFHTKTLKGAKVTARPNNSSGWPLHDLQDYKDKFRERVKKTFKLEPLCLVC